jgi:hypothetical protein
MLRQIVIAAAFLRAVCAQTVSTEPAPLEVTGSVVASAAGPTLAATIQTKSAQPIQGFVYETIFTDAETGKLISTWPRGCYRKPSSGIVLAAEDGPLRSGCLRNRAPAGAVVATGTGPAVSIPLPVPQSASGTPAKYSFNIDLVFFKDGTTWGPAKTLAAQSLQKIVEQRGLSAQ